jgi:hypothetical protein
MQRRDFLKGAGAYAALLSDPVRVAIDQTSRDPKKTAPEAASAITVPTYVNLVDSAEGPNWGEANSALRIPWVNRGGDYRDKANVAQGPTPYASFTMTKTGAATHSWDVTALVVKLLTRNTGIFLKFTAGGGNLQYASRENTRYPIPQLKVVTSTGTFNCPCIADTWIDPSSGSQLAKLDHFTPPALLKFDLSSVTGSVSSATLWLHTAIQGSVGLPCTIGAFYLDMPAIVTDPASQMGGVQLGLAANVVTSDAELGGPAFLMSAQRPGNPVLLYGDVSSDAVFEVDSVMGHWDYPDLTRPGNRRPPIPPKHMQSGPPLSQWTYNPVYVRLPQYGGISMVRVTHPGPVNPGNATGSNEQMLAHRTGSPKYYQRQTYDELYCRWLMMIDPNMKAGIRDGVKLGCVEADNSAIVASPNNPKRITGYSYRNNIHTGSAANPGIFRPYTYYFDAGTAQGSAQGSAFEWDFNGNPVCFKEGQVYSIEIRIKLNTIGPHGVPASDGALEWWVDGVKVFSDTARKIRLDALVDFQKIPWMELYHGGTEPPLTDISVWYGGFVTAKQYIGPPKKVA